MLGCTVLYRVVLGGDGLCWAVQGHTGLYTVVLGCTGWYWVVLGCADSYWVVLDYTGLCCWFGSLKFPWMKSGEPSDPRNVALRIAGCS